MRTMAERIFDEPSPRRSVPADVVHWRHALLAESGFTPAMARRLAGDPRYDLHELLTLVDHGCPPRLAVRILAPL